MAKEKAPAQNSTARETLVAISNAIALLQSDNGLSRRRMSSLAEYTREFYKILREHMLEELITPEEVVLVLLSCAALTQQARLAEEDRKVPAQQVLDVFFGEGD
jgi:hypothetical protein